MNRISDLAITLKSVNYEERSRIITGLTEDHGKITIIAKNAIQSRRFGSALEPFTAAQWNWTEKPGFSIHHLESVQFRRGFEGIRRNFDQLALASVLNETMLSISPSDEPCPDLFKLHANALAILDEVQWPVLEDPEFYSKNLLSVYLAKCLQWAGNQPQFSACLSCSIPLDAVLNQPLDQELSFHIADAGWFCSGCRKTGLRHIAGLGIERAIRIPASSLHRVRTALHFKIKEACFAPMIDHAGYDLILQLAEFHLPGFSRDRLKSFRFLLGESNSLLQIDHPISHPEVVLDLPKVDS